MPATDAVGPEPFTAFATRTGPALARLGHALTGDAGAGEDLAQEALARVWARWQRQAFPEHPDAYARRVLVNVFLTRGRRQRLREHVGLVVESPVDDGAAQRADRDLVLRALAGLSRMQRAVLVLRYFNDLPDEQIAALLGCPASTVRSHAARGLSRLRGQLTPASAEGADR